MKWSLQNKKRNSCVSMPYWRALSFLHSPESMYFSPSAWGVSMAFLWFQAHLPALSRHAFCYFPTATAIYRTSVLGLPVLPLLVGGGGDIAGKLKF